MCTVSVHVNENTLRAIDPALSSHEAINQWVQHQVDNLICQLEHQSVVTPPCTYGSTKEVIAESKRRMDDILNGKAKTIPHEEVYSMMKKMIESYAD